jgi:hypothetical protein
MTREEQEAFGKALCEKFLEDMVTAGILRHSYIDAKGRMMYGRADDTVTYKNFVEAGDDWLGSISEAGFSVMPISFANGYDL